MHELVEFLNQHYIVKAFGLSLLHSLWQGAIIAALLWGLLKISAQLSAGVRYCFALTALGSLLICFLITLSIQLNSLNKVGSIAEETASFIILSDETSAQAATEIKLFQELERGWNLLLFLAQQHVGYFFLAWTTGFFIFSFRFFTGLYYLRDLKQKSTLLPESWTKKVNGLQHKLGLHKKIILLASDRTSTPLTFGWLRPVIIFPLSMISLLPDEQVESILLHELAHIRRNDYLLNLLQSIMETIFFFNPGYWYISKVLEREREHVCDDIVLAHSPNPYIYARALSRLAELSAFQSSPLAMNIARKESSLLFRIKRIIQPSKSHIMERSLKRRSFQLVSLLVACTLLVFLTIDVNGNNGQASLSQKEKNQPAAIETIRQISGMVLSKYGGSSLPGVAVTIKNSTTGTVTDFDGNYSLNAQPSDTLVFSFVGFHKKELAVNNQDYHPVILENIEKAENSRLVLNHIKVRQNPDQPEKHSTLVIGHSQMTEGNYPEENAGIYIIEEKTDPKPIYIILEEDMFSSSTLSPEEFKTAFRKGRQVQDLNNIDSDRIASLQVLKNEKAVEYLGEAAKDGVIFITLKHATADINKAKDVTTAKGAVTIKSTNEENTATKAVSISTQGNNETKGTYAQPLYILLETGALGDDPGPEAYKAAIASGRQLDDPHSIDPATIASIDILKDASTTSLGEAAKNGVVFITLKPSRTPSHELKGKVEDHFTVFPNPANELVKISFVNNSQQHVTAEVLDPNNNKVHTLTDGVLNKGTHEYEWQTGGQPAGIYTILLKRGKEVKTTRLILE